MTLEGHRPPRSGDQFCEDHGRKRRDAPCEVWTHDPWFTRPVLYHWAKGADMWCESMRFSKLWATMWPHKTLSSCSSCLQRGLNSRPLVYKTSALPLSYRGCLGVPSNLPDPLDDGQGTPFISSTLTGNCTFTYEVIGVVQKQTKQSNGKKSGWKKRNVGLDRDLNPGPRAPEARIIPLDHQAIDIPWTEPIRCQAMSNEICPVRNPHGHYQHSWPSG